MCCLYPASQVKYEDMIQYLRVNIYIKAHVIYTGASNFL